jgi:hypothetical protein
MKNKKDSQFLQDLQDAGLPVISVVDGKPRYSGILTKEQGDIAQPIVDKYNTGGYDYIDQREYPSIEDQLDYIYHNGIEAWKADMIQPVKNQYPK